MEIAAEKLQALVFQAESTLDSVILDLEVQFTKRGLQPNPVKVIPSVQELKEELEDIKLEAETLIENQKNVEEQLNKEMKVVCKRLQTIEARTGEKKDCSSTAAGSVLRMHFENLHS